MADANKLTIELVDAGGGSGRPPTSPGSSTGQAEGASVPRFETPPVTPKIDELVAATKELVANIKPAADPNDWEQIKASVSEGLKPEAEAAANFARKFLAQEGRKAQRGVHVGQADAPPVDPSADPELPVIEPEAKPAVRDGYRVFDRSNAVKPSDLRPVLGPKKERPIGEVIETKEEREARQKDAERRQNNLLLSGIGAQNALGGGGIGQKAAGGVQLAGAGLFGKGAQQFATGTGGAAVQLAGVVLDLVDGAIKSVGQNARAGIRAAGDVSTSVARNDGMGAFTKGVDGAADALGKIPLVGTAASEALKTFTTVLNTAREVVSAFAERGRELRAYSGPIAQAAAVADVKKLQLDMAEANRFSAQYVKLIESESRINAAWRRATDPIRMRIMEFLADKVAPWLERMGEKVERLSNTADMIGVIVDNMDKLATFDFNGVAEAMKKKMKDIEDELKKRDQPTEAGMQAVVSWYTALDKLQLPAAGPNPNADRQLKLPVLMRMQGG